MALKHVQATVYLIPEETRATALSNQRAEQYTMTEENLTKECFSSVRYSDKLGKHTGMCLVFTTLSRRYVKDNAEQSSCDGWVICYQSTHQASHSKQDGVQEIYVILR